MINEPAFVLEKRIGRGRLSEVYLSRVPSDQSPVAIKVQEPDDDVAPHNTKNELKILQLLKENGGNQYVIPLLSHFSNAIELSLVFPVYSSTLNDVIQYNVKKRTVWTVSGEISYVKTNGMTALRIKEIFLGIIKGLEFIHSCGVIHRDINPNNIMFTTVDSDPVIIDFGISWIAPDNYGKEKSDQKFTDIATGFFKAPELLLSVQNYTAAVDIWAAAIVLCTLSSKDGKTPLDEDGAHSDLILLSSIFDTFGTPTLESWPEVSGSRAFSHISPNLIHKEPVPSSILLHRLTSISNASNDIWCQALSQMTTYESARRPTAIQLLDLLV